MEEILAESSDAGSYDPFTCSVGGALQQLECLDIGSAFTLGGMEGISAESTHSVSTADAGFATSWSPGASNLFGGSVQCRGRRVGDGVVDAFDFAVLLWSIFRQEPYTFDELGAVQTVIGRPETRQRCGTGESQESWSLSVAENYCAAFEAERRLDTVAVGVTPAASMGATVTEWAIVPGRGSWVRIRAPGTQLVLQLHLAGVDATSSVPLSYAAPPTFNCSTCVPLFEPADRLVVTFGRREPASDGCATITSSIKATQVLRRNFLSVRQSPPTRACAFDLFLWLPLPYVPDDEGACGGRVGVLRGSSSMDGDAGAVQRETSCSTDTHLEDDSTQPPPQRAEHTDPESTAVDEYGGELESSLMPGALMALAIACSITAVVCCVGALLFCRLWRARERHMLHLRHLRQVGLPKRLSWLATRSETDDPVVRQHDPVGAAQKGASLSEVTVVSVSPVAYRANYPRWRVHGVASPLTPAARGPFVEHAVVARPASPPAPVSPSREPRPSTTGWI